MSFVLVILIVLGAYWLESTSSIRFALGVPDHSAETRLEPEGLKISVALNVSSPTGLAEYYRRLTVTSVTGAMKSFDLSSDHGGFAPVSLYRREDGSIAIASSLDGALLLDFEKLTATPYDTRPRQPDGLFACLKFTPTESGRRHEGLSESRYVPGLFYVGRFDFKSRGVWTFIPASESPEYLRETGAGDFWESECR